MRRVFIELPAFTRALKEIDNFEDIKREIENVIMKGPEAGDLIQGTGGLRKIRVGDAKRKIGKSGAFRVLYLDMFEIETVFLVLIFTKAKVENITSTQKNQLKDLILKLKRELTLYEN